MNIFKYLARSFQLDLKRNMEYKTSFWFIVFLTPLWTLPQLLFMEAVFSQTTSFIGYTKYESYVLIGTYRLVQGITYFIFYARLSELRQLIRGDEKQTFDMVLLKPIDSQLYATTGRYVLGNISSVVVGLAVILYALQREPHIFTLFNFFCFIFAMCLAIMFLYVTFLFLRCFLFWFQELQITESLWDTYQHFGKYPARLYTGTMGLICNIIIPITLMASIPVDFLFGRMPWYILLIYAGIVSVLFILTRFLWFISIKKYSSFGS